MQQEIFSEAKNKMSKAIEHYKQEVSFIRTGRASTHILNPVKVDYYGTPTPLNNVANITIPEAQLISIQPFDPSSIELIEKAITESDIGLTPIEVNLSFSQFGDSQFCMPLIYRPINKGQPSLSKSGSIFTFIGLANVPGTVTLFFESF